MHLFSSKTRLYQHQELQNPVASSKQQAKVSKKLSKEVKAKKRIVQIMLDNLNESFQETYEEPFIEGVMGALNLVRKNEHTKKVRRKTFKDTQVIIQKEKEKTIIDRIFGGDMSQRQAKFHRVIGGFESNEECKERTARNKGKYETGKLKAKNHGNLESYEFNKETLLTDWMDC